MPITRTTAKRKPGRPRKEPASPSFEIKASKDAINPEHYKQGDIECLDAIKASMPHQQFIGFLKGNHMKYVWRFEHKGGVQDLEKARWYLDRMIAEITA